MAFLEGLVNHNHCHSSCCCSNTHTLGPFVVWHWNPLGCFLATGSIWLIASPVHSLSLSLSRVSFIMPKYLEQLILSFSFFSVYLEDLPKLGPRCENLCLFVNIYFCSKCLAVLFFMLGQTYTRSVCVLSFNWLPNCYVCVLSIDLNIDRPCQQCRGVCVCVSSMPIRTDGTLLSLL